MPVQSDQHPCMWCMQGEGGGAGIWSQRVRGHLPALLNSKPDSLSSRSFPSLSEAPCFLHELPDGPWTKRSPAHTAAESRWVKLLQSVGGKGITHLSIELSPEGTEPRFKTQKCLAADCYKTLFFILSKQSISGGQRLLARCEPRSSAPPGQGSVAWRPAPWWGS